MLPKKHRLPLKNNLNLIKKKGKSFSGKLVSLIVVKTSPSLPSRYATIVSKKIAPQATARNLLRRRLHAAHRPFILNTNGLDILTLPQKTISAATFSQLKQEISTIFKKIKRLTARQFPSPTKEE